MIRTVGFTEHYFCSLNFCALCFKLQINEHIFNFLKHRFNLFYPLNFYLVSNPLSLVTNNAFVSPCIFSGYFIPI